VPHCWKVPRCWKVLLESAALYHCGFLGGFGKNLLQVGNFLPVMAKRNSNCYR
jgi:hypothetical protein